MATPDCEPNKMPLGPQITSMPGDEVKPATQKRDLMLEIWTLVALGILVHGDQGSYRGVRFAVHLQGLQHKKRILALNPAEEGFPEEAVEKLMSEPFKLFYEGPEGESGGGRGLVMTCPSSLKLAADWKARGFAGVPKTGANDAFGSPIFFFHTLNGKPNPNGPLVLGSMRDAVAEKIRWNPETGSSIHGTLEELNKRFEEVVVRLPKVSKKEGAKPHVWVRRATSKRGGSQKNKLKRKWEEELGGLKKRIWEGGSALRRDLKRKTGPGNVVEGRSKRMRAAYGKPLGSSQGGLVGQGGQTANEHKEGGGASQHKGTVAHRKEGLESTQGKQHAAKGPSAKAEGLRHEKDFMGTAPEVPGVPQERRRLEGNGGGKHVNEEKEPSKVGSLIQGVEQRKEADGKACQGAQCGGGQGQIGVQTFEVEGKDDGVGDTQGGGNEGSNQGSREHLNAGQTNQAEVGSGKKACNEEAGNAAGGGEQDKAKPAVLVKGPGLRLRISLKDLPGPVTKVPRQPESVAPREAVHTAEGQEKTAEQLREGAVGAKASPKEQKDEAVESRERLPGTAAERGGRAFGERGNRSPVENVEAAVEGQSEVKRGLANGGSEAAEGGKDRETAARRSQALETSRTDVGSALEESEPNKTSNPQAPDCLVEERTSSRKLNNGGAHLTEPREDAEAVRKLVREAARTKLSELQLVTGRYREIERALLELLKAPDCRPEFKVELKLALRRMRDGELPTPPRWDRPEDDASEKECPTGFEEMRAERSRSGGESSLRIGDVIAGGGRDVIAGVTLLGPSEKLRAWREARARKMTSSRVAPIFVPSRGRADLAYLNFEGKCALGPERVGETPVVVFVRGEELEAYRARWPELLFAILPSGQGCTSIGGVRNTMKRFAAAAGLSHYWEIDDNVMGFVAGPERRHVAMWEALLYGQRRMLECAGERVGVFGFECWKGMDEIPGDGDLFLKANSASIYKVRLIDCHVTSGMRYRPFLQSKEDILFNAEFTCRGGRTLKSLWYRYVRSFWSQGGCHDARNSIQGGRIASESGPGEAADSAELPGARLGAGNSSVMNKSGRVDGSEKTGSGARSETVPEKAAARPAPIPAAKQRPQFPGPGSLEPASGARGGGSVPKMDSGVASFERVNTSAAAGSLEPNKRPAPLTNPAVALESVVPGTPSGCQPGTPPRSGFCSSPGNELFFSREVVSTPPRWNLPKAVEIESDGSDSSAGGSESETESGGHLGSPPRSAIAPLNETPAPLTPPPVTPRKKMKRPGVKAECTRPAWMERNEDDEDSLVPAVPMSGAELAAALQDDVTLTEAYVKEQRALRKRGRRGGLSVKLKAAEKQRQLLAKLDKLLEMGTYTLVKRKKLKRRAMEEDHDLWECPGDALSGDAQGKTRAKMQLAEAADETAVNELELRETHREIMAVADRLGKKGRLRKSPFGGQVIVRLARLLASRNARVHRQAARALSDLAGRCDVSGSAKRVDGFRKAARDALGFLVDHWELFKDERFGMRLVEVNKLFRLGLPMFRRRVLRRGICSNAS